MNIVKYLGVIFDKNYIEITHGLYSLFRSERLNASIKFPHPHKALIRSVITYACPAWEVAAETHLLKLQHLK
jgi:hypothetical protein